MRRVIRIGKPDGPKRSTGRFGEFTGWQDTRGCKRTARAADQNSDEQNTRFAVKNTETNEAMVAHGSNETHGSNSRSRGGWMWLTAGVLMGLIVLQGGGFFESAAKAEMSTTGGTYSVMTTDGGNDEIMVVVDSRQETIMVYRTFNNNKLSLIERENLASLFTRARARAIGAP